MRGRTMNYPSAIHHDVALPHATEEDIESHQRMVAIHRHYSPPLDLIECEVLDALLQNETAEHIATFSQLHIDTIRRALHVIEITLHTSSTTQIIDNCTIRRWSSMIRPNID